MFWKYLPEMSAPPLRVMMLGLRGFPEVQGGVETHAEHLCPLLVKLGCEVTVLAREPYQPVHIGPEWNGVKFVSLWAPKSKGLEAILHSFIGMLYAAVNRPDILHIQAIGPAIMTFPARLLGLRVVVTHHGPDYDRQKWGWFARFILKLGERCGMRWSQAQIVISKVIRDLVHQKYGVNPVLIPNGVVLPELPASKSALDQFGLEPGRYVLLVSRLVPEKRHLDLIEAFARAAIPGWKLVLVGGADHPDAYQKGLFKRTVASSDIVMTGFQRGIALSELYAHAGFFVLPSSHEGLPIAMLEALSFGLPVLASDIPANLEVKAEGVSYFALGDVAGLTLKLREMAQSQVLPGERATIRQAVMQRYDWSEIAQKTYMTYMMVKRGHVFRGE